MDEEHELLPQSLLSSTHCNTLEHDGDGDNHVVDDVELDPDETDKLFLINLFSGPTISGHTPTITNLKHKHTMTNTIIIDPIKHVLKKFKHHYTLGCKIQTSPHLKG